MIDRFRQETLANTLKNTGLAASATEAMRMAENILRTESRVADDFDRKKQRIDDEVSNRYKNKEEEINDLINKTSFENKNYFVPVKGFRDERVDMTQKRQEEIPHELEVVDLPQGVPEEKEAPQPVLTTDKPALPVLSNSLPVQDAIVASEELTLKELMDEDAKEIYGGRRLEVETLDNSEFPDDVESDDEIESDTGGDVPAYNIVRVEQDDTPKSEPDDFIMDVQELDDMPVNDTADTNTAKLEATKPQEVVKEPETKKYANPIDDVDLMSYFKFG